LKIILVLVVQYQGCVDFFSFWKRLEDSRIIVSGTQGATPEVAENIEKSHKARISG
jgi:hypothetical protein